MTFIQTFPNTISPDTCQTIIDRFLDDKDNQRVGQLGPHVINKDIKQSTDLYLSGLSHWEDIRQVLYETLARYMPEYIHNLKSTTHEFINPFVNGDIQDTGFQIQQTKPGEFYTWHDDSNIVEHFIHEQPIIRQLTYIWYLNTVPEGDDGYTEFIDGTRIQPVQGSLLIFPATWTYLHRGVAPKTTTKYITTGWLCNYRKNLNRVG